MFIHHTETNTKYNKKGRVHDYTNEDLEPLNEPKLRMNLWRALVSNPDTEFKLLKKALPRVYCLSIILKLIPNTTKKGEYATTPLKP